MKLSRVAAVTALALSLALPAMAQPTQTAPQKSPTPSAVAPAQPSAPKPSTGTSTAPQSKLVDINSASTEELDGLPGVGKARSQAIIDNRPYKGKDDLVRRNIIPQNVYDGIKDKIVARQSGNSGNRNTTTQQGTAAQTQQPAPKAQTPPAAVRTTKQAAPSSPATATTLTTGQFATEADARRHCPRDQVVWANTSSQIYHFAGNKNYANTKQGAYMCQQESDRAGFRAAKNEKAPQ